MAAIRPFTIADQQATRQLILDGLGEHFAFIDETLNADLADIQKSYIAAGHIFVVAEANDCIIGSGALLMDGERSAQVVRMSVAREQRRRGVGQAILDDLIRKARALDMAQLILETNDDWLQAIHFYQQARFQSFDHVDGLVWLRLRL